MVLPLEGTRFTGADIGRVYTADGGALGASGIAGSEWSIIDASGEGVISFTSFLDIDVRNEGKALTYPIEKGSFASYNKVQDPLDITLNIALQGDESAFNAALESISRYRKEAVILSISTPSAFFEKVTLESFTYTRNSDKNSCMLTVEMMFKEVREVETQVMTTTRGRTSQRKKDTGQTSPTKSTAHKIGEWVRRL